MQNFSQRLAESITRSGKAKGELAAHVGVALSTVSRWLGGTIPKTDALYAISTFLGVNANWLLTGEGPRDAEAVADGAAAFYERGMDPATREHIVKKLKEDPSIYETQRELAAKAAIRRAVEGMEKITEELRKELER